jgi:hypothetical protein
MTATISKTATTILWPDGRLDVPEGIRQALGISGGWECSIEIVDGALVVRPLEQIPDDDLWLYEPETYARLIEAGRQPVGSGISLSPDDIRALAERRVTPEELMARSKQ